MSAAWWQRLLKKKPRSARRVRSPERPRRYRPGLEILEDRIALSAFVPDTFTDNNDGNYGPGQFSLREAVLRANASGTDDTIALAAGTYTLSLTGQGPDPAAYGDLDVTKTGHTLTLQGAGAGVTIVDAGAIDRALQVFAGATVLLSGVTITNGQTEGQGGGIDNAGTLTLVDCAIANNTLPGNSTDASGGGIYNSGTLSLTDCTLSGNTSGNPFVTFAGTGGAIANAGTLTLTNCTLSGNAANLDGGGLDNLGGTATLQNVTVANNRADSDNAGGGTGGGLWVGKSTTVTLTNTIVAQNTGTFGAADDVNGTLDAGSSYNLIGVNGGLKGVSDGINHNQVGASEGRLDPALGPLQDNGGPTATQALDPRSPALDAGTTTGAPATDQRHLGRVGPVDLGAYEYDPYVVTNTNDSGLGSLRQAILNNNASAGGNTIHFDIGAVGSVQTIQPHAIGGGVSLPIIDQPVVLDGWSQGGPGYTGPPLIQIDGASANDEALGSFGFWIQASNVVVRGFTINRFAAINGNGFGIGVFGGSNTWIYGNYLGTDATGLSALPNGQGGIWLAPGTSNDRVGTDANGVNDAAERNVIAGNNAGDGILLQASGSTIAGNYLGLGADGTTALGNAGSGVAVTGSNNLIGGTVAAARNAISGNGTNGILIRGGGTGNLVEGNFIGTDATGALPVPNGTSGVRIDGASGNTIGGTAAGAGNVLAFNGTIYGLSGVDVVAGTGNAVLRNSFFGNAGLGIDLGADGVTPNDPGDADTGPNNLQNFPVLADATLNGGLLHVAFSVPSAPGNAAYPLAVDFYLADATGQGKTYLGSATYSAAQAQATARIAFAPLVAVGIAGRLVATATDSAGNTSEFSAPFDVNVPPVVSLSPGVLSYTEKDPPTPVDLAAVATDADNTDFGGGTLTVGFAAGGAAEDRLAVRNQGTGPGQVGVVGSSILFGGGAVATFTGGSGTAPLVLAFNGRAFAAAVQAVLRNVTYADVSAAPSTVPRTVRFLLTDGHGGTSDPATRTVTVTPVNDAPVLNPAVHPRLASVEQDDPNNGGTLVADLSAGDGTQPLITDADANPLQGIAVVGVNNSNGTWQFSTEGGPWTDFGAPADTSARLLAADSSTRLRFVSALGFSGTVANGVSFRAWDQTAGVNGGLADASHNGAATAFSTAVATAAIAVVPQPAINFVIGAPASATSGAPLTVTVTAFDGLNRRAISYRGTVHFSSSDAASGLPADYTFTSADAGAHTWTALLILRSAGTQTVTVADVRGAVQGGATFAVANVAPSDLGLDLSTAALEQGQSLTLAGHFTDPGILDRHTVTIAWGDGTPATVLTLAPGARIFSVDHRYDATSPVGSDPIRVSVADDQGGSTSAATAVLVQNTPPGDVRLNLSATALNEGQSLTLTGGFTDPDTLDAHTVAVDWGDGSPGTTLALTPGTYNFQFAHRYADAHATGAARATDIVRVIVSDDHGGSAGATAAVTVQNIAPSVTAGPMAFLAVGTAYFGSGLLTDPGDDGWAVRVDYGDGSGAQPLALGPDRTFRLQHVYDREGSFIVTVTAADGNAGRGGARFFVHTYVAGPLQAAFGIAAPGSSATAAVPGLQVTLDHAAGSDGNAAIVVVKLPTGAAGMAPSAAFGQILSTYDVRALNVSDRDVATLLFEVDSPTGAAPVVSFLDPTSGFTAMAGSAGSTPPVVIERIQDTTRYRITIVLNAASTPRLIELTGTIITTSVPAVQEPTGFTATPNVLAGAALRSGDSGLDGLPAVSFARTGLVSGSQRTAATAPTQAALPDFGVGGEGPPPRTTALVRNLLAATHSAFWESVPDQPQLGPDAGEQEPPEEGLDEAAFSAAAALLFARAGAASPLIGPALADCPSATGPAFACASSVDHNGEEQAAMMPAPGVATMPVQEAGRGPRGLLTMAFALWGSLLALVRRPAPAAWDECPHARDTRKGVRQK